MTKSNSFRFIVFLFSAILTMFTIGCQSPFPTSQDLGNRMDIDKGNYNIAARSVSGYSEGVRILFITIYPSYEEARNSMFMRAGLPQNGKYVLVNCKEEKTIKDYFLWEFPKLILTADIIEPVQQAPKQPAK